MSTLLVLCYIPNSNTPEHVELHPTQPALAEWFLTQPGQAGLDLLLGNIQNGMLE